MTQQTTHTHHETGLIFPDQVLKEALVLIEAGFSIMPILPDGTKRPYFNGLPKIWDPIMQTFKSSWKPFQSYIPSREEVMKFFYGCLPGTTPGIGIICGKISGGLEVIDADDWETAEVFRKLIQDGNPALYDRLVLIDSPRPGLHLYYRCSESGQNRKLAQKPDSLHAGYRIKCMIEVKAEGGVCIAPGSPPECHPTSRPYQYRQRHLTEVPTITAEERNFLIECGKKLNRWSLPSISKSGQFSLGQRSRNNGRPGDDFNVRATWEEVLKHHKWTLVRTDGNEGYWRRPGKQDGHSATTNHEGYDLLYVFSSNASPFDNDCGYTKFGAYTLLNFNGDYSAAARNLKSPYNGKLFYSQQPNQRQHYRGFKPLERKK